MSLRRSELDRSKVGLLLAFARALHHHGAPAHRLEREVGAVAAHLGLQASFFSTPTMLLASFGADEANAETHVLRVQPGGVDLGRLAELDALGVAITRGTLTVDDALDRARVLAKPRPPRQRWSAVLASAVASGSAASLMGGGYAEIGASLGVGLVMGLLGEAARRHEAVDRLQLVLAGGLSAAIAGAVASEVPLALTLVTVAGIITHVPGLTLTVAMTELSTNHLASGSARTFAAMTTLAQLGFGSLLGASLASSLGSPVSAQTTATAALPATAAVLLGGFAFARLLEARRRDLPLVVGAAVWALWASRLGEAAVGGVAGVAISSTLVGVAGNATARLLRRPASLVLIPGILLLVPGSLGYRSLAELLAGDVVAGVARAVQVGMIAVALAAGQVVAHAIVPPRREL